MTLHIRPAVTEDTETIVRFIRELAAYEQALHEVQATAEHIRQTLFCPEPRAFALICEDGSGAICFAVYFFNYSTWQGQYGLYLEDLHVSPQHRGKGAGQALR